jgi:hypothetical protein
VDRKFVPLRPEAGNCDVIYGMSWRLSSVTWRVGFGFVSNDSSGCSRWLEKRCCKHGVGSCRQECVITLKDAALSPYINLRTTDPHG